MQKVVSPFLLPQSKSTIFFSPPLLSINKVHSSTWFTLRVYIAQRGGHLCWEIQELWPSYLLLKPAAAIKGARCSPDGRCSPRGRDLDKVFLPKCAALHPQTVIYRQPLRWQQKRMQQQWVQILGREAAGLAACSSELCQRLPAQTRPLAACWAWHSLSWPGLRPGLWLCCAQDCANSAVSSCLLEGWQFLSEC